MNNEKIVESFYKGFKNLDSKAMNALLADDIVFEDEAFGKLKGDEVKFMWQFLMENAKDFSMEYSEIKTKDKKLTAKWKAEYTFSTTGNKVINNVESNFIIENGKIVEHIDHFDIKKWAKQALGNAVGTLSPSFVLKKMIQSQSKQILKKYMNKNQLK